MNLNEGNRRNILCPVFKQLGFKLTKSRDKADEYECENDTSTTFYFYWKQGKDGVNLAIDPRVPFDDLLAIPGVYFQKTEHQNGIRFGTTMKKFPPVHDSLRPKSAQSRVGRMFVVMEASLPDFMKQLALTSGQPFQSVTHSSESELPTNNSSNSRNSSRKVDSESGSLGYDDSEKDTISDMKNEMQLATDKIEDEYRNKSGEDVDAVVKRRVGQSVFRALLALSDGMACHISGLAHKRLLIASHIVPWSKATGEEKTDPNNGLLLAVNWDAVFDKGFLSFDDQGKAIFSNELDDDSASQLGIDKNVRLRVGLLTQKRVAYLKRHREEIFEHWKKVA